jgi:tRNA A37 threonylcarbamoyladenosine synthetase subunit TsaC/SUA5/YrdC
LLDGGVVEGGVESTIVDIRGAEPKILREGAIKSGEVFRLLE